MDQALVTETGESFLSHRALIRHIREKLGDAIADYVAEFLGEDAKSAANKKTLAAMRECLEQAYASIADADNEMEKVSRMMAKMGVE